MLQSLKGHIKESEHSQAHVPTYIHVIQVCMYGANLCLKIQVEETFVV